MDTDRLLRKSRWMMRLMEWDDPRARYPNLWSEGMPAQILARDRLAARLRLGDLIAVFYPASQRHPERSNRFLGLSRVIGLRRSKEAGTYWIDLETAHRFREPLDLNQLPSRVFLCCDTGWPSDEVELFGRVFGRAVAEGWKPLPEENEEDEPHPAERTREAAADSTDASAEPAASSPPPASSTPPARPEAPAPAKPAASSPIDAAAPTGPQRSFAGVGYSGDMRDRRDSTWLATVELASGRLRVVRLEATGRAGLQSYLRNPDRRMMELEAVGLDFPFGLPEELATSLIGGPFPDEGWWALARRMEKLARPEYLTFLEDFRSRNGAVRRLTDERCDAGSPLQRADPDLGSRSFHGIRMIAEDRSRFAIRPFESAQGKLLLEVYPGALFRRLCGDPRPPETGKARREVLQQLARLEPMPIDMPEPARAQCVAHAAALAAVVAARSTALAVETGEASCTADQLDPAAAARIRREGWIYGLREAR